MIIRFETDNAGGCRVDIVDIENASAPELKTLLTEMELNRMVILNQYRLISRKNLT